MPFSIKSPHQKQRFVGAFLLWMAVILELAPGAFGNTIGTVVPILGQPGTLAYDATTKRLFISDTTQNRVEVYSIDQGKLLPPIPVGHGPLGIAIIPESHLLVVCNTLDTFLSLIDISTLTPAGTIPVTVRAPTPPPPNPPPPPENPFSVAALAGGNALLSTNVGLETVNIAGKTTTPLLLTGFSISSNSYLVATGDRKAVLGEGGGVAFLYNPVIPVLIEQIRNVGNFSVLASDQTGSHFMIGDSQFNRQFFQTSEINPFTNAAPIDAVTFSPDGGSVMIGFNQSPNGRISIMRSSDLGLISTFLTPEPITGPITVSPDGATLFAISQSGITVVDLTAPPNLPSLQIDKQFLSFSFQMCNLAPAAQSIQITNSGSGVFSWSASASLPGVTLNPSAGSGPSSLQVTIDPSGFASGATAFRGTALVGTVTITSKESTSGDQTISILLNLRNPDQIGSIFPVDGFLSDILVDDARQQVYLVNSSKNRIEIFSLAQQSFLPAVPVGAIPKSIAFSSDRKQLLVTSWGTEYITQLNADTLASTTSSTALGPIPHPAPSTTGGSPGTHPFSIAQALNGETLVVGATADPPPHGTAYGIAPGSSTAAAFPLLGSSPNLVNGLGFLAASGNGGFVLLADTSGSVRLYDGSTGNFAIDRSFPNTTVAGNVAAAADGSYYHAGVQLLNNVLAPLGVVPSGVTTVPVSITGFVFAPTGTGGYRGIRPNTTSPSIIPPRIEKLDAGSFKLVSGFNIAEGLASSAASPQSTILRQLGVDGMETTLYGISDSGLIVIPLPGSGSTPPPQINPGGIVNGASYAMAPAPVAPGSIASIFGSNFALNINFPAGLPLPTTLGGVCLTFDGVPAPLFFVSPAQLNVQVPWELTGRTTSQVAISSTGFPGQPLTVTVNLLQQSPGIFTFSGDGQGAGAILHSSNSSPVTASNPATIGEIVSIYATGLGPTSPALGTGLPAPTDGTVYNTTGPGAAVFIDGANAPVGFSGLAPGFVGLYQVNVRIPSNAPVGTNIPVQIIQPGQSSNQATIAIVPATP